MKYLLGYNDEIISKPSSSETGEDKRVAGVGWYRDPISEKYEKKQLQR